MPFHLTLALSQQKSCKELRFPAAVLFGSALERLPYHQIIVWGYTKDRPGRHGHCEVQHGVRIGAVIPRSSDPPRFSRSSVRSPLVIFSGGASLECRRVIAQYRGHVRLRFASTDPWEPRPRVHGQTVFASADARVRSVEGVWLRIGRHSVGCGGEGPVRSARVRRLAGILHKVQNTAGRVTIGLAASGRS